MFNLVKLYDEIFVNKSKESSELINKYELDQTINNLCDSLSISHHDNNEISAISSSFLTSINSKLSTISNLDEKEKLEYIISEIAFYLLVKIIKNSPQPSEIITDLTNALKSCCKLNNYNYSELNKYLRLDRLKITIDSIADNQQHNVKKELIYYEWHKSEHLLSYLVDNLFSEKIISSKKDFISLFSPIKNNLIVRADKNSKDFIVILFDQLYQKKIITPRKGRGHFMPLKLYFVDFDEKIFFSKNLNKIKYGITKNVEKYERIKEKIEKWLS